MLQLNILHGANRSADAAGNTSVAHAEPQSGLMDLGKITAVFMVNLLTTIPNGADCFCFHRNGNRLRPAVAGAGDGFHARVQLVIDHRIGKGEYDGAIGKRNAPAEPTGASFVKGSCRESRQKRRRQTHRAYIARETEWLLESRSPKKEDPNNRRETRIQRAPDPSEPSYRCRDKSQPSRNRPVFWRLFEQCEDCFRYRKRNRSCFAY